MALELYRTVSNNGDSTSTCCSLIALTFYFFTAQITAAQTTAGAVLKKEGALSIALRLSLLLSLRP